ncbi:unnamed protein product [Hapterophycus canaliculatus]
MDNEDGLLTEELQAKPAFDTLGSTADDVAKKHAQEEAAGGAIPGPAPSELILPVGDPMGKKLLRTMGWREGQGVGNRVRRKRQRPERMGDDQSAEEELPEMARAALGRKARELLEKEGLTFAPKNVDIRMQSVIPKTNLYGVGHDPFKDAPEFRASNRAGAIDAAGVGAARRRGVYSTEDLIQRPDDRGATGGTNAELSRSPAALDRGSHGFVLDDEEDDVYESGIGKEAYDGELDTDGGKKMAHDDLAGSAKAWALNGTADEDEPMLASRRYARCPSDGRQPPTGFVVAQRPDVQQKHWAPPIPPANFRPTYEFEDDALNPLRVPTNRRYGGAGLDAVGRARLLGEISGQSTVSTPPNPSMPLEQGAGHLVEDSSALSFLSPAARRKLLEAANGARAPRRFSPPTSGTSIVPLTSAGAAAAEHSTGASGSLPFSLANKFTSETSAGATADDVPVRRCAGVVPASRPAGLTLRTPTTDDFWKKSAVAPGEGEENGILKQVQHPVRRTIDWIPASLLCKRLNVPVPKASSTVDWAAKGRPQSGLVAATAQKEGMLGSLRKFVPDSSTSSRPQIPLLKGMEQLDPVGVEQGRLVGKLSPSESSGVSCAVVANGPQTERPPIDLFKSIFESESESDSEEEEGEREGDVVAAAATGEADPSTLEEQRAPPGSFGKTSVQRGYGTDSSDDSTEREQLRAERRVGNHHFKNLEGKGNADSGTGRPRGDAAKSSRESGSDTRRSERGSRKRSSRTHDHSHRNIKKHKKHKSNKKDSKSEKKRRKHEEKKKKHK